MPIYKFSNAGGFGTFQRYNDFLAGNPATLGDAGAMFPLQVVTVGAAGASSVTFSNIPATYTHLQIRFIARTDRASNLDGVKINFNSDTTSSYSYHILYGTGSGTGAEGYGSQTYGFLGNVAAASQNSNVFGVGVVDVLDYANTNKFKTVRALTGDDNNSADNYGFISLQSTCWQKTNAITSITLDQVNGTNFVQNTQFALYGVKSV